VEKVLEQDVELVEDKVGLIARTLQGIFGKPSEKPS
jgi:hypothetical protein